MKKSIPTVSSRLQTSILFFFLYILTPQFSEACGVYGLEKNINSKIKEVIVFLQGAQVHRTGSFYVQKGVSEVVFDNISPFVNKNSIQAKGKGNFTILEVRHHIHYPAPPVIKQDGLPPHIKKAIHLLEDSLFDIGFTINEIEAMKKSLEMEKGILLKTPLYKGEGKSSDSIPLLKDGMVFFRSKMNDINRKMFVLNKKEAKTKTLQVKLNQRLSELKQYKKHIVPPVQPDPIQQVIVTVSSKQATSGSLDINYMVSNAGWSAHYDLRAKNTTTPIELTYKAKVYQQTGEDWKNVRLKLSTNNPNKGNVKPTLPIWYLDYYAQRNISARNLTESVVLSKIADNSVRKRNLKEKREELDVLLEQDASGASDFVQLSENIASIEFNIDLPYSIQSNGESHLVEVQKNSLPSKFYHAIVPKLDRDAFVMAKLTGWENLNLLPATATIFFDGTYIGQTMINPLQLSDTLSVSLGRDASVYVERNKRTDKTKPQVIGNNLVKTLHFDLVVKNKKSSPIQLVIEDQIPISKNSEIKIDLEEKGKAKFNEKSGTLKWNLSLNQGKEQKLGFSYSIKYDKDKQLLGKL